MSSDNNVLRSQHKLPKALNTIKKMLLKVVLASLNSQNMQFGSIAKHVGIGPSTWFSQVSVFTMTPCTYVTTVISKWKQNAEDNPMSHVAC